MSLALAADGRMSMTSLRAELDARELQLFAHLRQAAELRDTASAAHMQRMPQYARLIARGLGLSHEIQDGILVGSALHDIGTLGVPEAILNKREPLNPIELVQLRRHVRYGYSILQHGTSPLVRMAAEIALRHHERFDGSGYPDGLHGASIPLNARIAAVADVYDALTSHRPYRAARSAEFALKAILEQRGRHFDPDCVDAFVSEEHRIREIHARYTDSVVSLPHAALRGS